MIQLIQGSQAKQQSWYEQKAIDWFCAVCHEHSFNESVRVVRRRYPKSAATASFMQRAWRQYQIWGRDAQ